MATKAEIAEYINNSWSTIWSKDKEDKIDQMLTPELAAILIKLVGDVEFLVEVKNNKSN